MIDPFAVWINWLFERLIDKSAGSCLNFQHQRITAPSQAQVLLHQAVLRLLRHMLNRVRQGKQSD